MYSSLTSFLDSSDAKNIFNIAACQKLVSNFDKLPIVVPRTCLVEDAMLLGMAMRYAMIYVLSGEDGLKRNNVIDNALPIFTAYSDPSEKYRAFFKMAIEDKEHRGGGRRSLPDKTTRQDFVKCYRLMWDYFQSPKLYYEKCSYCGVYSQIFHKKASTCVKCGAPLSGQGVFTIESPFKYFRGYQHPTFDYDTVCGRDGFGADYPIAINNTIATIRTVKRADWKNVAMAVGWWALDEYREKGREGASIYFARQQTQISIPKEQMGLYLVKGWQFKLKKLLSENEREVEDYLDDMFFEHDNWGDRD